MDVRNQTLPPQQTTCLLLALLCLICAGLVLLLPPSAFASSTQDDDATLIPATASRVETIATRYRGVIADDGRYRVSTRFSSFDGEPMRSDEHTYELQSLMPISYAVFCLNKKN